MSGSDVEELLHVTLDVWHPDCWGIESTEEVGSTLVGHGAAVSGTSAYERCTIYGESPAHVEQAVDVADDSRFINRIEVLGEGTSGGAVPAAIGQSTRDVFIEYVASDGIGAALVERGFVLNGTYRVEDGDETWDLLVSTTREELQQSLDTIRADRDADVTLTRLSPVPDTSLVALVPRGQQLTACQRDALALARERGYYEWPRAVSAGDLAAELDVSKATFLEHLRKAESKLLGGDA